jgi:hypothetical protein
MKTTTFINNWLTAAALLFSLPTAYFILINVLNGFGISSMYEAAEPTLDSMGIKEGLGWNINLLLLFGPVLAFFLTVFQVLNIELRFTKEEFLLNFSVQKKWLPLLVTAFSAGVLIILFLYALGENCNC